MNKVILLITLLLINFRSLAIDLEAALTSAYTNNDDWKRIQRDFLDEIEKFPQALSGFLPSIAAEVDSVNNKTKGKSQYNNSTSEVKTLQKSLVVSQPIFNGGRDFSNLKAAQSSFRASRGKYYASEQQVILNSIKAYLDCYETKEIYAISETSVKNNNKQLEAVEEKLKLGEATETDLASAKAGLAAAETNKLTAYANFQAANANFLRVFGVSADNVGMPQLPGGLPASLQELTEKSVRVSPNIVYARHSAEAAKATETAAKANLLPQVSFRVQAGRNYYDPESRFSSSQNSTTVTSTLSVNVPIYTQGGAEYSRIRKAKNQTSFAVIQVSDQMKKNNSDCIASWEGFNAAKSKIKAASEEVEAAQVAYDGIMEGERVGTRSVLEVLDAEDKLHKAKIRKVAADKECVLAAYQLKSLLGELTAKSLKLNVAYFNPEDEFKKMKLKVIGF